MNVAWVTDIHLNFVSKASLSAFAKNLSDTGVDAVLIGGDIAEAPSVCSYLEHLVDLVDRPLYFVLGNHDYYHGSIAEVRAKVETLQQSDPRLVWMPASEPVALGGETGLVGHGGWGDGRLGDFLGSNVMLNDYVIISELAWMQPRQRLAMLHRLGDEAAQHLGTALAQALERFAHVIILMHVPPFREACWYGGRISDDDWLPHFSCEAAGRALLEVMRAHPDHRATVLCGHTHGSGFTRPLPNRSVHTGAATYGHPAVQQILTCR
jgi:3',5'-cyclic AMP phosphodiesterase CpdA